MMVRTPNAVAPLERQPSSRSAFIGPAMSRWAHGTSPTNSLQEQPRRQGAAVLAADVLQSATSLSRCAR